MKIAVMSPSRDQGITTVSILLGQALAQTQGLTVCVTHSGMQNVAMESYLGLKNIEDKTKSITQLLKLLESNSIDGSIIGEFCTKIVHNFEIFNTDITNTYGDVSTQLLKAVVPNARHDIVITDIVTELWEDATQQVIKMADIVIIVVTQNILTINKYNKWKESELFELLKRKPSMFVVNKFDGYISAFKDYTKKSALRHIQCCKISYSPFICRTANIGQLHTILPYIIEKDTRVCELNNDIRECMQVIMAHMGEQFNWR